MLQETFLFDNDKNDKCTPNKVVCIFFMIVVWVVTISETPATCFLLPNICLIILTTLPSLKFESFNFLHFFGKIKTDKKQHNLSLCANLQIITMLCQAPASLSLDLLSLLNSHKYRHKTDFDIQALDQGEANAKLTTIK